MNVSLFEWLNNEMRKYCARVVNLMHKCINRCSGLGMTWGQLDRPRILVVVPFFPDHTIRDEFLKTAGFHQFKNTF